MIQWFKNCFAIRLKPLACLLMIIILLHQQLMGIAYAYNPYSTHELEELEKEFIQIINQSNSIIRTPLASQYLNHLAKRLTQFSSMTTPYFFIVKSREINAFAGPGGNIGINTQLILVTGNESELAAVMAHEIAHVKLHHLYRMIQHQKQMRIPMLASLLASLALGAINPSLAGGAMLASMGGFAQDSINFTRANEKESDRIGIRMLIQSGLDPRGMAGFFKKMQQNSRYYYTANVPAILRTHPLDEDRIAEAENRSPSPKGKHYPDNLEYRLFKELIRNNLDENSKQLLDYYNHQCRRHTGAIPCEYGYSLALINQNQYEKAQMHLKPLLAQESNNLFYQVAMSEAELGLKQYDTAIKRLKELRANYPENYAALMAYAHGLLEANRAQEASRVLLKGFRQFKRDLTLCETLAQAQSSAGLKGYAYLTQAQCFLLQGHSREALRQLKVAKKLSSRDRYLQARVVAMIEDIKYMAEH